MKKGLDQVAAARQTVAAPTHALTNRFESLRAVVRDRRLLRPAPEALHGIEFGSVGGQSLHPQPMAIGVEVGAGLETPVRLQAIPEQDHGRPQVPPQMAQEAHHLGRTDRSRDELEVNVGPQGATPGGRAIRKRSDGGQLLPAPLAVGQDRRLAARRPRPADGRSLREAALVEEDDRRSPACGVFFTCGHRSWTQR